MLTKEQAVVTTRSAVSRASSAAPGSVLRPPGVEITPRNLRFGLENGVPRYWMDGDPFMTHFMNGLSIIFPPGERMFMDAVRAARPRVSNPATLADIRAFLAQEAIHFREHGELNKALENMGYPARRLEANLRRSLEGEGNPKSTLAETVALEHLTAILGHKLLSQPHVRALFHPDVLPLWMWHAVEEMEHKAVAFDVYEEVYGDYSQRAVALVLGTLGLFITAHWFQYLLLRRDGLGHKPGLWLKGLWRMWGVNGLLIDLVPAWLDYLRRDFHPWQNDDSGLLAEFKSRFETAGTGTR
jgi:predicted metal-dependent hydrolase